MKECAALGHAVAHWSFLEEKILQATLGIAAEFRPTDPPDARQHAFRTYSVVVEQIPSGAAQTYYMAIRDRIAAENSFRQKLVHGIRSYFLIVKKPSARGLYSATAQWRSHRRVCLPRRSTFHEIWFTLTI